MRPVTSQDQVALDLAERIRTEPGFKKELAVARAELLRRNWKIPGALWLPVKCEHNGNR